MPHFVALSHNNNCDASLRTKGSKDSMKSVLSELVHKAKRNLTTVTWDEKPRKDGKVRRNITIFGF